MAEDIAVDGMGLEWVSASDSGDIEIVGTPSTKVQKIPENKGVYNVTNTLIITDFENANVEQGTGTGIWTGSLLNKTLAENAFVLKKNDIALVAGVGKNKSAPPPTLPFASTIKITDAKQDKVNSN